MACLPRGQSKAGPLLSRVTLKLLAVFGTMCLMFLGTIIGLAGLILSELWPGVTDEPFLFTMAENFPEIMAASGIMMLFFSLFGCMAIGCDTLRGMPVYLAFVVICVFFQGIVIGITLFTPAEAGKVKHGLTEIFEVYKEGGNDSKSVFIDFMQRNLECCGITDYQKDLTSDHFRDNLRRKKANISSNSTIPFPCCRTYDWVIHTIDIKPLGGCMENPTNMNSYTRGCAIYLYDFAYDLSVVIVLITIFTIITETVIGVGVRYLYTDNDGYV